MKVAKIKDKKNNTKIEPEKDSYSLKSMLTIILIILVTFILFYIITFLVLDNKKVEDNKTYSTQIDSNKIIFNSLLNRSEDEYYVLAYKSKSDNDKVDYKVLYDDYLKTYRMRTDALKVYEIDIDDAFNKQYIGEELNISDNLEELKINDEVLFKIKNNKIEETYIGNSEILDKLSVM